MSEITLEKNHALLEKLANYVMAEVPTKREMNDRFEMMEREMDVRFKQVDLHFSRVEQRLDHLESDVKLILEGMDSQVQEM